MLATFDYYGAAALVAAVTGMVTAIGVILNARKVDQVHTRVENVQAAVSTANGHTVGELAERSEARQTGEPVPEGSIKDIQE